MITIKNTTLAALQNGTISAEDFTNELINKYPVKEIAETLTELYSAKPIPPKQITVSKEDYDAICGLFRIQGTSSRGRKKKIEG